jgi:hypothetical protein
MNVFRNDLCLVETAHPKQCWILLSIENQEARKPDYRSAGAIFPRVGMKIALFSLVA